MGHLGALQHTRVLNLTSENIRTDHTGNNHGFITARILMASRNNLLLRELFHRIIFIFPGNVWREFGAKATFSERQHSGMLICHTDCFHSYKREKNIDDRIKDLFNPNCYCCGSRLMTRASQKKDHHARVPSSIYLLWPL